MRPVGGRLRAGAGFAAALALLAAWALAPDGPPPEPTDDPAPSSPTVRGEPGRPSAVTPKGRGDPGDPIATAPARREAPDPELPAWLRDSLGPAVEEDGWVTNRDPGVRGEGIDPRDQAVLAEIIERNDLDEDSSERDYDDGDGVLEPWELGFQVWHRGRLVALLLGPDPYWSFGYGIKTLPEHIGDLDALRYLDLHGNALESLPEGLRDLAELRELRLQDNGLTALPDRLDGLFRLRVLGLGDNRFTVLPDGVERLESLERLHLNGNPLEGLPQGLERLERLRVLAVEQSHPGRDNGLSFLPFDVERHPSLERIYLAGNRLGCAGPAPSVASAPGPQVYGLGVQSCAD